MTLVRYAEKELPMKILNSNYSKYNSDFYYILQKGIPVNLNALCAQSKPLFCVIEV